MASYERPANGMPHVRVSDADRDQTIAVLRDGAASGQLSHDTFVRRMELVFAARERGDLDGLVSDLRRDGRLARIVLGTTARASSLWSRVRGIWRAERTPAGAWPEHRPVLALPRPGSQPLLVGRAFANDLRLDDQTVSRTHAVLVREQHQWVLRDLGSKNGTYLNGRRVMVESIVRPGDLVSFGRLTFRVSDH